MGKRELEAGAAIMYRTVHRSLELAYVFQGAPFVWRCSVCGKLFAPPAPELTNETLADINREFKVHVCYPLLEIDEVTELDKQLVPSTLRIRKEP